jgi:hypothetical protein
MFPTKFRFIWPSDFRGEDFLEMNQSETRIACGGHVNHFFSNTRQNGEWTETSTRQNEIELTMFGE